LGFGVLDFNGFFLLKPQNISVLPHEKSQLLLWGEESLPT
jgi:hypothetical protein